MFRELFSIRIAAMVPVSELCHYVLHITIYGFLEKALHPWLIKGFQHQTHHCYKLGDVDLQFQI